MSAIDSYPLRVRRFFGWCVHFYTALGVVASAGIAVLIVEGTTDAFRWAFVLMLIATLIDATDGTLARAVKIKETIPGFDGRRLDDLIDFLNYSFLPLFLLWRANVLPDGQTYLLLVPLLASAYGFCQVDIKTQDGYFLGFPSYWNIVAFYLYALQPIAGWVTLATILVPAFLTFVPSLYLYPTMMGRLNFTTNVLSGFWVVLLVWALVELPTATHPDDTRARTLALVSLFFPVYYMSASWFVTLRRWFG
jgi:phosphatidylcholine synthase